ncbi:uncharacterized protein LOC143025372 [Oratosquilla oratoria]|uniref:uncharacterized protein LOC143025372 n=1 Tax=Oratosquilla oratoria TaxID=337810 RepID=UPI003F76841B
METGKKTKNSLSFIKEAVSKIVELHQDFPSVVKELGNAGISTSGKTFLSEHKTTQSHGIPSQGETTPRCKRQMTSKKKEEITFKYQGESTPSKRKPINFFHDLFGSQETSPQKKIKTEKSFLELTSQLADSPKRKTAEELKPESQKTFVAEVILEQMQAQAESVGVGKNVVAVSVIKDQVKQLHSMDSHSPHYESLVKGLMAFTELVITENYIEKIQLQKQLINETDYLNLSLEVLWNFHKLGIVSFQQVLTSIQNKGSYPTRLQDAIVHLIINEETGKNSQAILQDFMYTLIQANYLLTENEFLPLRKLTSDLLRTITEKVLDILLHKKENKDKGDEISETENNIINIYDIVLKTPHISTECIKKYFQAQLKQIITHKPKGVLIDLLKEQENWKTQQAHQKLSSFIQKLLVGVGVKESIDVVKFTMENQAVNWLCVLCTVTTVLQCSAEAHIIIKKIIEVFLVKGFEEKHTEQLLFAFVIARQAGLVGRFAFPSYGQWFARTFSSEVNTPAASKQHFVFLMKFLTNLVPHEPLYCLRAHVSQPPFVPRACHDLERKCKLLSDYNQLARSRIMDLQESVDLSNKNVQSESKKAKVLEAVEAAVTQYSQSKRVPNFVLEAAIFKQPYFLNTFLPALLSPRHLPSVPDAQMMLIETLHTTKRIPHNMYKTYLDLCEKEANDLLCGVFREEEDIIMEEPLTELNQFLFDLRETYQKPSGSESGEDIYSKVLPLLSKITKIIEEMLKTWDLRLQNSTFILLDCKRWKENVLPKQILEAMLSILVDIGVDKYGKECKGPPWLPQFVALIAGSVTMQSVLFSQILSAVTLQVPSTTNQIRLYGVLMAELSRIEDIFLPVKEVSDPKEKEHGSFVTKTLASLQTDTVDGCLIASSFCQSWIQWHLGDPTEKGFTDNANTLPNQLLCQFHCLAPHVAVLQLKTQRDQSMSHICEGTQDAVPSIHPEDVHDRTLSIGDVYARLQGVGVPPECSLYFADYYRQISNIYKPSLEKLLQFELEAAWEDTPQAVQQTFLQQQFLHHVEVQTSQEEIFLNQKVCDDGHHQRICKTLLLVLAQGGINKKNAASLLLLLQWSSMENVDKGWCLLEEWKNVMNNEITSEGTLEVYMSICQLLPPKIFLDANRLVQLFAEFKNLVNALQIRCRDVHLNIVTTSFLLKALLMVAAQPSAKDAQLSQYLQVIATPVILHWKTLQHLLKPFKKILARHKSLESFYNNANKMYQELISKKTIGCQLDATVGAMGIVAHIVDNGGIVRNLSPQFNGPVLYWLLVMISVKQIYSLIRYFPDEKGEIVTRTNQDESCLLLIEECKNYLKCVPVEIVMRMCVASETVKQSLPSKLVPLALTAVLLSQIPKGESKLDAKENVSVILNLLLYCHHLTSKIYEMMPDSLAGETKEDENIITLDYLSDLAVRIISIISRVPASCLNNIKNLKYIDPEIRSAIYSKCKSNSS